MKTVNKVQGTLRLLAQLSMAASYIAAPLALGAMVSACDDENDPKTWVKHLDDPGQRIDSIKRLSSAFESAMTKASSNRNAPEVKAIVDICVEKLTKLYVDGALDEKTRVETFKFLADMRDPRTAPALKKSLDAFEQGRTDDEARFACESVGAMAKDGKLTDAALIESLWTVFEKFKHSKGGSGRLRDTLHDTVIAVKSPTYLAKAIAKLAPPIPEDPMASSDQFYWQRGAIHILRDLKSPDGVKPLVKVLVSPTKTPLNGVVLMALLKMPKEAEPVLIAALNGTDPEIAAAADGAKDKANLAIVADALGRISRPAGRDAVLAAIATADTDTTRAGYAQSLVQFPPDPRSVPAFLGVYKKLGPDATTSLSPGAKVKYTLTQVSAQFYDPTLVPWLAKEAAAAPEREGKIAAIAAAIDLFTAANKKDVEAAFVKADKASPNDPALQSLHRKFDKSAEAVAKCGEDAGCYVKLLDEKIVAVPPGSNGAPIKATYMAVVYGGGAKAGATRADLAKRVEAVTDPATRLALVDAIDKLALQGDANVADAIDKIVQSDQARGTGNVKDGSDDAAAKVALRLRARALP